MDSRHPISLVKIDSLTLELFPLFGIGNYTAKPILAFIMLILSFHQSYYILQLLTIDHDCQVPVDKHGSVSFTPPPLTPPRGSKIKYFNFAITKAIVNIFAEILQAGRAAIDMKHIRRDFSLKAWVRVPWVDLGGGAEAKIKLFKNMVMLHIK